MLALLTYKSADPVRELQHEATIRAVPRCNNLNMFAVRKKLIINDETQEEGAVGKHINRFCYFVL